MKRLLTLVAFFATLQASAQQVNPVPDYVFANRMSAGRNTVTDTAAYFSIGPRYGATRGMMPPMVVDTASFSVNKRNGLLIFSVQKNKFLYWDSVGVKWAEMAGTGGSAIAGTGTTNYVPKFTGTTIIGNSQIFDNGTNIGINTSSPFGKLDVSGLVKTSGGIFTNGRTISAGANTGYTLEMGVNTSGADSNIAIIGNINRNGSPALFGILQFESSNIRFNVNGVATSYFTNNVNISTRGGGTYMYLDSATSRVGVNTLSPSYNFDVSGTLRSTGNTFLSTSAETYVGTTTDAGDYKLQVSGNIYNTGSAVLAATSGNVSIGTASPSAKMHIVGSATTLGVLRVENSQNRNDVNHGTINIVNTKSYALGNDMGIMFSAYRSDNTEIDPRASIAAVVASSFGAHLTFSTRSGVGTASEKMRITEVGEMLINTTSDAGDYKLQVNGNIYNTGSITTGAPSGGSIKPWKIGEAATVSPTSPNRTLRVEVDGVVYYIHAKTTND